MGNKVDHFLENVKTQAGQTVRDRLIEAAGTLGEKPAPSKQAKYMKAALSELTEACDSAIVAEIMNACGGCCISAGTIEKTKKFYKNAENMQAFIDKLNENHIGGGKLRIDGNKIIWIYETCYCGLAKNAKDLSPVYCNCSVGWFKKLFSSVFDKDISVEKQNTILDGTSECTFNIYYQ